MYIYRKFRRLGKQSAIKIQALYRGYRIRYMHLNLLYENRKYSRLINAVKIQSIMRMFLFRKKARILRQLYTKVSLQIQRIIRGWLCRFRLKIAKAANRIKRLFKLIAFFKFKDIVIMIMQLRRMQKKRIRLSIELQRVIRGFLGRKYVFRKRLYNILCKLMIRKIQKWYRIENKRRKKKPWKRPTEEMIINRVSKKLSKMLLELYLDYERRQEFMRLIQQSLPEVQRMIRGFLGRAGTRKLSFLRKSMRNWMQPRVAIDFMEKFLNSRIFYLKIINKEEKIIFTRDDKKNVYHIRNFLTIEEQTKFEIHLRKFEPALEKWYDSVNMPLSSSEKTAIIKQFKNPMNGNIRIKSLDEFINYHKLPCRKHGRFICGDCVFRKNCQIGSCKCQVFISSTADGHGICKTCDHPGSLHSLCPSQVRILMSDRARKKPSLLKVLNTIRDADMSIPTGVEGVLAEDMIVTEPTADDIREKRTLKIEEDKKTAEWIETHSVRSMSKLLSLSEVNECNDDDNHDDDDGHDNQSDDDDNDDDNNNQ